ncbi:MAG: hypothetical protein V1789_10625 [PVC group bacterium]
MMNRLMDPAVPVIIFFLTFSPALWSVAGDIERKEVCDRELVRYRCRLPDSQTVRWEGERRVKRLMDAPPDSYTASYREEGIFGDENRKECRLIESRFTLTGGQLAPLRSRETIRDQAGEVVNTLEITFDRERGEVRTQTVSGRGGIIRSDRFTLEPRMVYTQELWLLLRSFPFPRPGREDGEMTCEILTGKPASYSLLIQYDGREDVTTPAGTFSCHRLRMIPDLGVLTWLGKLAAPTIYLWFTIEPPHHWIRYAGPESGPGTPEVVIETIEIAEKPVPCLTTEQ